MWIIKADELIIKAVKQWQNIREHRRLPTLVANDPHAIAAWAP